MEAFRAPSVFGRATGSSRGLDRESSLPQPLSTASRVQAFLASRNHQLACRVTRCRGEIVALVTGPEDIAAAWLCGALGEGTWSGTVPLLVSYTENMARSSSMAERVAVWSRSQGKGCVPPFAGIVEEEAEVALHRAMCIEQGMLWRRSIDAERAADVAKAATEGRSPSPAEPRLPLQRLASTLPLIDEEDMLTVLPAAWDTPLAAVLSKTVLSSEAEAASASATTTPITSTVGWVTGAASLRALLDGEPCRAAAESSKSTAKGATTLPKAQLRPYRGRLPPFIRKWPHGRLLLRSHVERAGEGAGTAEGGAAGRVARQEGGEDALVLVPSAAGSAAVTRRADALRQYEWVKNPVVSPPDPDPLRLRSRHIVSEALVLRADEALWLLEVAGSAVALLWGGEPSRSRAEGAAAAASAGDDAEAATLDPRALLEDQPRAIVRAAARRDLSALGWIVRDGGTAGADFLVYPASFTDVHASAAVVIASPPAARPEEENRRLVGLHRAAHAASRELWVWTVDAHATTGALERFSQDAGE